MRKAKGIAISWVMAAVLVVYSGCTSHQVIPTPQLIEPHDALKIPISNTVAVRGKRLNPEDKLIVCDSPARDYWATYNDLTNASVAVLKDALRKSNVNVDDHGEKILTLSVVGANCKTEDKIYYLEHTEFIKLKVRAGDSIVKEFEGTQTGEHERVTPLNVEMGITCAVLAAIKDPDIIEYMKN